MPFIKNIRLPILVFGCLAVACTDNFDEVNTDPNRPEQVYPGALLGQLQYRLVNTSIGAARSFTHEVMQVEAPRVSTDGGLHRYQVSENAGNDLWNSVYRAMTDVEDLRAISERLKEDNYRAIALIYQSWGYSLLTDCFGDIPYSQATRAAEGTLQPAFDRQKDIYVGLLSNLETANALLDDTKALTFGGDQVYNANALSGGKSVGILRWKKFANSLRLRLLLRILKRDGEINVREQINAILGDAATYPVFTAVAEDAIFRYTGTFPYFNPYYNARVSDWRGGNYYTQFFLGKMNAEDDPRRAIWATRVTVGGVSTYQGIRSGYESNVEYAVDRNSSYLDALKTLPQLGIMMTYSELEFIKAELALKGFATGKTAKAHYDDGITASMAQWGVALPAGHLQKPGVAYPAAATQEGQLAQILGQKYYALFFTDYQSWFEKRRTGYPELPWGPGIPAGNQFPSRLPYPNYLQSLNPEKLAEAVQFMGGDDSNVRVWWEKD
ncbi:MAG: SusD/RagB family nutrient-binding outer membrane lipoprotein [Ferruginibacter sp.]|nr:SusD/RagB family nutrient-binding outer membrane lipoprotein [Cytophagales bacterium]